MYSNHNKICSNKQEEARRAQAEALKAAFADKSESERRELLEQFDGDVYGMQAVLAEERDAQRDRTLAKLRARRRMKEEVIKETTVTTEMERITASQVRKWG